MPEIHNMIMPPSAELAFLFAGKRVCSVPAFVLQSLITAKSDQLRKHQLFNMIEHAPDKLAQLASPGAQDQYIRFLQEAIPHGELVPFLSCPTYLTDTLRMMWSDRIQQHQSFSLRFQVRELPTTIYRYMRYHPDRTSALLRNGRLFMPCPAMFNDPFDCSLSESMRLSLIEVAIGCFSTISDSVLMFSHYADNHKGMCVGFDTQALIRSLSSKNPPLRGDLRPVWYYPSMPPLSLATHPALCATCKHDIWAYENEYRVFMIRGSSPAPHGEYQLDRAAISEIVYGCMATDDSVAECKRMTMDLGHCVQKKAVKTAGAFGISIDTLRRI